MNSLERILVHPIFGSSPQLSAFLNYVVTEEIAGRGELIKAYSIAVDALGRPDSFDPARDPSIRVMASRLRKSLDAYYDSVPAAGPVRIGIVKGSYRPTLAPMHSAAAHGAKPADASRRMSPRERRYLVAIVALSVVAGLLAAFVGWNLLDHGIAMMIAGPER